MSDTAEIDQIIAELVHGRDAWSADWAEQHPAATMLGLPLAGFHFPPQLTFPPISVPRGGITYPLPLVVSVWLVGPPRRRPSPLMAAYRRRRRVRR